MGKANDRQSALASRWLPQTGHTIAAPRVPYPRIPHAKLPALRGLCTCRAKQIKGYPALASAGFTVPEKGLAIATLPTEVTTGNNSFITCVVAGVEMCVFVFIVFSPFSRQEYDRNQILDGKAKPAQHAFKVRFVGRVLGNTGFFCRVGFLVNQAF